MITIATWHEPETSCAQSIQNAGRGVCISLHGSVFSWSSACLVSLFRMLHEDGRQQHDLGRLARRNLNSVPDFDTNRLWDHRKVVIPFCLLLQHLFCPVYVTCGHRLDLHTSLSAQAEQKSGQ